MRTITLYTPIIFAFFLLSTQDIIASQAFNTIPHTYSTTSSSLIINPTDIENEFLVKLSDEEEIKTYKLLNASKEMLYEVEMTHPVEQLKLDLRGIPGGQYYISVSTNTGKTLTHPLDKN